MFGIGKLKRAGLLIMVVGLALLGFRRQSIKAGRQLEKQKQTARTIELIKIRKGVDNELSQLDNDGLRGRGSRWVRGNRTGNN